MSRRFRICMAKRGRESARPSYGRPKLTLISREKNHLRRCYKKPPGRNFDFRAKSSWEKFFNIYKNFLSGGFRSKVKIVTAQLFATPPLFLLATRVLPASPNFGQAKHGQNGPAATVCQQCICCPICEHHFTHWTHPNISLPFRAGDQRLKISVFHEFACHFGKKFVDLLRTQFWCHRPSQ